MDALSLSSFVKYPSEIKYDYLRKGQQYSLQNDICDFAIKKGADQSKIDTNLKFWEGSVDAFVQFVIKCIKATQRETCIARISSSQIGYLSQGFFECAVRELYYIHEIKVTHIDDLYKPHEIIVVWPKDAPSKADPIFKELATDFVFTFEEHDQHINCHKEVLCSKSSFFEKLLKGVFRESGSNSIVAPNGTTYKTIKILLTFLYTGAISLDSLSKEEIIQLLTVSKYYDFQYLSQICTDYLRVLINENTVEELADFAERLDIEDLKKGCEKFLISPEITQKRVD